MTVYELLMICIMEIVSKEALIAQRWLSVIITFIVLMGYNWWLLLRTLLYLYLRVLSIYRNSIFVYILPIFEFYSIVYSKDAKMGCYCYWRCLLLDVALYYVWLLCLMVAMLIHFNAAISSTYDDTDVSGSLNASIRNSLEMNVLITFCNEKEWIAIVNRYRRFELCISYTCS